MCDFIWCHTTPEGAATIWAALIALLGGILALAGAWILGSRQLKILNRQTDIQTSQTEIATRMASLEELKLKSELFDDRYEVYRATREWVRFINSENRRPRDDANAVPGEADIINDFIREWDRSRFLFRPRVHVRLKELLNLSHKLHYVQKRQLSPIPDPDSRDFVDEEYAILGEFLRVSEDMADVFGDELFISHYDGERVINLADDRVEPEPAQPRAE
nr:hypothetical protein [uncultured Brevundimonas sp.]